MWLERFQEGKNYNIDDIKNYWCTSYACQRAYEGSGYKYQMFANRGIGGFPNACNWYSQTILPKTDVAKVGCIACWSGGTYGHIAYVEDCSGNHIKVSQASSSSTFFITEHDVKVGQVNKELGGNYIFLGFIETPISDIRTKRDETKLQVKVMCDYLRVRESPNGNNVTGLACPKGIYDCTLEKVNGVTWAKLEDKSYIMTSDGWTEIYQPKNIKKEVKELITMCNDLAEQSVNLNKKVATLTKKVAQIEALV